MKLSIVIPAYNESAGIQRFHDSLLTKQLAKIKGFQYEIIYINDGSNDDTLEKLHIVARKDKRVKIINLSRNFGKEIATTAGIHYASGDATIIMDSDGQHPPKMIPAFLEKWENGAQVVIGIRSSNEKEGFIKKWGSKLFYRLFNTASDAKIVPRSTDFRLIDQQVQKEFIRFSERDRITRGLIDWLGYRRDFIEFNSPARLAGEASYKTSQLFQLAINSFTSLSLRPLFFFGWVGIFITLVALIAGIFIIVEQFILGDPLTLNFTGAALLGIFISFLVGIVLTSQGMLAIYLSHIHKQAQARPLFSVDIRGSRNIKQ